ncbi:hypothetical protein PSACC_03646 [Paramicrosporidium saccamoebae]|uniref:Uncharacterized protein n=1 Tax=Paramicrosporidium saccamoebae TaxID=1246581 RepID=A0A2H9TFN9_9FUNG|nr:hypothetical protein PSACC_03646 [Paramicrosporidium saccamoebae]
MSSPEKRQRVTPLGEPRVWVFSMDSTDSGCPLHEKRTIGSAVEKLMENPNVGSDDISAIGAQHGLLMTERPRMTNDTIGSILLMREKLLQLEEANEKTPGLFTQVLGIQERAQFYNFAGRIRRLRNQLAHPDPKGVLGKNLDLVLALEKDRRFLRLLADWDPESLD